MSFGIQGNYTGFQGDLPSESSDAFQLTFQPVIPFTLFDTANIFRLNLPYQTDGRGDEGFGQISFLDVFLISQDWARLAVGPLMTIDPTGTAPDSITGGFAFGGVKPIHKRLNVGIFTQNLLGGETAVTQIQPILAYQLGNGWSLSLGDLQYAYDWEASRWTNVPIGWQVGMVTKLGNQPARFFINPQYNLRNRDGLTEWSVTGGVTFLLPSF